MYWLIFKLSIYYLINCITSDYNKPIIVWECFLYFNWKQMWAEIANRLDSSPGPLLFEMTTLPTLPQLRLFGSWHFRCHEFESPWSLLEANASFNRNVYQWGRWPFGPCLNAPVSYNLYLDFLQWNFAFVHFAIYSCVDAPLLSFT